MFKLAFKSVKHNPKRLILTAISVALGVSLIAATLVITNALSSGFNSTFKESFGSVDVMVNSDPDSDVLKDPTVSLITDDVAAQIEDVPNVEAVDGTLQAVGLLLKADGSSPWGNQQGGPPTIIVSWSGNAQVDSASVVDGRAPEARGEAVLDTDTAKKFGYNLGDQMTLTTDAGPVQLELVGTVRLSDTVTTFGANVLYTDITDVRSFAGVNGFDGLTITTTEGTNNDTVVAAINEFLPEGVRAITGQNYAAEQTAQVNDALKFVDIFNFAFAIVAVFVGAYIIVNTFRITVTQRTREFGLLRAVGVTGKQLRSMILLEALIIGLVASALGILLGWGLAALISMLVEAVGDDIFGAITLPIDAVIGGFAVGILVTMVAAFAPALHASRISPMEALREAATSTKKSLHKRNITGLALTITGVVITSLGLFGEFDRPYIYVGVGVVLIILGVTLLAAQLLIPLVAGLRPLLIKLFKVDGKLAANNLRRESRRSANTSAALMIGVMLLALIATLTASLKLSVNKQIDAAPADLYIAASYSEIPAQALDLVRDVDGIQYVVGFGVGDVRVDGDKSMITVVDPTYVDEVFPYDATPSVSELTDGIYVSKNILNKGYSIGDQIEIEGIDGVISLEIQGRLNNDTETPLVVNDEIGQQLLGTVTYVQAAMTIQEGADIEQVKDALKASLSEAYPTLILMDASEVKEFSSQLIDLIYGAVAALLATALIIAIIGVANTLLLSVTERTKEIGLLRAVGMRRRGVWRMITIESIVLAIFGTLLGMILGGAIGAALTVSLKEFGLTHLQVPVNQLLIYMVLAAIAGVLAAISPARRASKLDILEAVSSE